jgi:phosphoenolpyruvate-protein kinase (PTS system EI component)
MPTKLPQNFGHAARPGEIVLPMSCGYPGIVMGPAYLINNQHYNDREILKKSIRDNHYTAEQQSQRLEDAFSRCEAHYERQKLNSKNMPVEIDDEFEGMVETESLLLISEKSKVLSEMKSGKSPELAIYDHFETRIATLKKTYKTSMAAQNKIMAELSAGTIKNQDAEEALRKEDFAILNSQRYIGMVSYQRDMLISQLFGKTLKSLETAPPGSIPAASSYPVGDLIYLRNSNGMGIRIHGLICWDESMNNNDHTAIMSKAARATLAKIDKAAAERIREGDRVIIDGRRKIVIINPAPQTIAEMTKELQQHKADSQAITDKSHARKWAKSVNEETIKISANIGYADDMMATQNVNAAAIGLYRTEIPVLTRLYGTNLSKWIEIF